MESNRTRKDFIADRVLKLAGYYDYDEKILSFSADKRKKEVTIGVLSSDHEEQTVTTSDRVRSRGVYETDQSKKVRKVVIYEPALKGWGKHFFGSRGLNDLQKFKDMSQVIIANRYDKCLDDVAEKYIQEIFSAEIKGLLRLFKEGS